VDRAYSNYWFNVSRGAESKPFDEAIRSEQGDEQYVQKGFYAKYLKMYWRHFDRSQLHVCFLEDLQRDCQAEMTAIFAFLGADPDVPVTPISSNPTRVPKDARTARALRASRSLARVIPAALRERLRGAAESLRARHTVAGYRPMSAEAKAFLVERYREANAELGALLGRDLGAWSA
jgi:hypothetical protein